MMGGFAVRLVLIHLAGPGCISMLQLAEFNDVGIGR